MKLKVIAYARNGHTDKFGIPRQSRDESPILTRIVFEPEYAVKEALRGIEGYSHLWLIWGFREQSSLTANAVRPSDDCKTADAVRPQDEPAVGLSWSPTVRPPRLGGNKRMGVFATRSPYRPNPIGLSSVRLLAIAENGKLKMENGKLSGSPESRNSGIPTGKGTLELIVSGADVLDGTPIYDIKPYLSFSDSHPDAQNGFAEETKNRTFEVVWGGRVLFDGKNHQEHELPTCCLRNAYETPLNLSEEKLKEICYILSQDPRPGYQDDPEREYKLDYDGYKVTFAVEGQKVIILKIEKKQK